jgi:23S rRNA (uracil1939-C5)-methyltransferase
MKTIAVVGLGLIGGSLAAALRGFEDYRAVGVVRRQATADYAMEHGISFFDLRAQVGLLRDIIIRNSASGELMVIIQFHYDETGGEKEALDLLQHVADTFPQITSLLYLDNQKCNDTIGDQDIIVFKGTDHIFELMEDLKFKVGPK